MRAQIQEEKDQRMRAALLQQRQTMEAAQSLGRSAQDWRQGMEARQSDATARKIAQNNGVTVPKNATQAQVLDSIHVHNAAQDYRRRAAATAPRAQAAGLAGRPEGVGTPPPGSYSLHDVVADAMDIFRSTNDPAIHKKVRQTLAPYFGAPAQGAAPRPLINQYPTRRPGGKPPVDV